jgi:hypothetical protein
VNAVCVSLSCTYAAVPCRFSVTHEVGMPDVATRAKILDVIIKGYIKEKGPNAVKEALREVSLQG